MSPAEFDRIYEHLHDVRAELIDGVVYVASPVIIRGHGREHLLLATLIGTYLARHSGTEAFLDGSYIAPGGARVQPDVCLFHTDGGAFVNDAGYLQGVPEFIAEIANTSADYDLGRKMRLYEGAGVGEYVVWRTADQSIDCFRLVNGSYTREPFSHGVYSSAAFPGLHINVAALLTGDIAEALAALDPA